MPPSKVSSRMSLCAFSRTICIRQCPEITALVADLTIARPRASISFLNVEEPFPQVCVLCCSIQRRTSSTRQTVTRAESFSGAGNVRSITRRHNVDLDIGMNIKTCGCRRKPVSGSVALLESTADMIWPFSGDCAGFKNWE